MENASCDVTRLFNLNDKLTGNAQCFFFLFPPIEVSQLATIFFSFIFSYFTHLHSHLQFFSLHQEAIFYLQCFNIYLQRKVLFEIKTSLKESISLNIKFPSYANNDMEYVLNYFLCLNVIQKFLPRANFYSFVKDLS